jgi:predicted DCC family thiol-disulfide oxidoreductase YuxK
MIVLFDGVCNLCSASVQFMIARDPKAKLQFAAIQSDAGKKILREHGMPDFEGDPDSILLVDGDRIWDKSSAALRIVKVLRFPWFLAWPWIIVPRFIRDAVYRFVAKRRYKWFGKKDSCLVPTPELRARFLS